MKTTISIHFRSVTDSEANAQGQKVKNSSTGDNDGYICSQFS